MSKTPSNFMVDYGYGAAVHVLEGNRELMDDAAAVTGVAP